MLTTFYSRVYMSKIKLIICCCLLIFCQTVLAEEFNYHVEQAILDASLANGIKTEYVDIRYNSIEEAFTIEAQFSNKAGKLANGFHFAVSDTAVTGPGSVAFIYFDASKGLANPLVSGYAYNNRSDSNLTCANITPPNSVIGSWKTVANYLPIPNVEADYIFNPGEHADTVLEKSAVDEVIGGYTYRTFRLVLDTQKIDSHIPIYVPSYNWKGIKFFCFHQT